MIVCGRLFLAGKPISEEQRNINKYTQYAYDNKLNNYRIINIGDIVSNKWKRGVDLPIYLMDFIGHHGEVLMIANIVGRKVPQMVIRALREKEFSVMGNQTSVFYGFGYIPSDFKYGDPIVLVESALDRDVFANEVYPGVLATLTAGLSSMQKEVLKYMTNNVILCYDNDEAGRQATSRDFNYLKKLGFYVRILKHPNIKDCGDLAEMKYMFKDFEYENALAYYKANFNILKK